jgi:hypothetical protein
VREVLDLVLRKHEGPVIAPMTLVHPGYFDEVVGRLREDGHEVRHFALLAERSTVLGRLEERGWGFGLKRESFAVAKLDEYLDRLQAPEFAEHIRTDDLPVPDVATHIAGVAGLPIDPNLDGRLRRRVRRYAVSLRHVRFD